MKVKLNRGPMKNKYIDVQDYSPEIIVEVPKPFSLLEPDGFPSMDLKTKRGSYRKSNTRLKNGAYVFEWMGWYE